MKKEAKSLIICNILFYIFIFIHMYYQSDYVPEVLFYMFLAFSSVFLEQSTKKRKNQLLLYAVVDFLIRVATLIIHYITLLINYDINKVKVATVILLMVNIIFEITIFIISGNENECETVEQSELNKFIEDLKCNRIDFSKIGVDLKKNVENILKILEVSGKTNIIIITLLVLIFISRFTIKHLPYVFIVTIFLMIMCYKLLLKLTHRIVYKIFVDKNIAKKKYITDVLTFTIGYTILFIHQVIFNGKIGTYGVSLCAFAVMCFIPMYKTKFVAKEKLVGIYREVYHKSV